MKTTRVCYFKVDPMELNIRPDARGYMQAQAFPGFLNPEERHGDTMKTPGLLGGMSWERTVQLLDTTAIHAHKAVEFALG